MPLLFAGSGGLSLFPSPSGVTPQPHADPLPSLSPQCHFFQRTRYYRIMPKYHAVRIRQEQRYQPGGLLPRRRKKHWVTKWQEPEKYY